MFILLTNLLNPFWNHLLSLQSYLIGSQRCDLFTKRTFLLSQWEWESKNKTTKIELALRARSILKSRLCFQSKLHDPKFNYHYQLSILWTLCRSDNPLRRHQNLVDRLISLATRLASVRIEIPLFFLDNWNWNRPGVHHYEGATPILSLAQRIFTAGLFLGFFPANRVLQY